MTEGPEYSWIKRGMIFMPSGQGGWMNSHAQVPTALVLDDRIRVYISSRPKPDVSLTGYVDVDLTDPARVIAVSEQPILELGGPGTFDEHGIMPSSAVREGDRVNLYYSGWCRLAGRAPYHNTTGLAVSDDGGHSFRRGHPGPVLDRAPEEPFSATSPCVIRHENQWHVFYSSGLGWLEIDGKLEHVYDIRHATSDDGVHWQRHARAAVSQAFAEEALTRPTLLQRTDGSWDMWFCSRGSRGFRETGEAYRIRYAHSPDLWEWTRNDAAAGIGLSDSGVDSEMMAYPNVLEVNGRKLMFYNGNGFGRDGFAWAEWRSGE